MHTGKNTENASNMIQWKMVSFRVVCLVVLLTTTQNADVCAEGIAPESGMKNDTSLHSDDNRQHYSRLIHSLGGLEKVAVHISYAADWLVNVAQITNESLPSNMKNGHGYKYNNWTGAFRNEYDPAEEKFDAYGPVWHCGQAIRGLIAASKIGKKVLAAMRAFAADGVDNGLRFAGFDASEWSLRVNRWMNAAVLGGGFILDKQVQTQGAEYGMILAYENNADNPQTSTMLEGMRGLYDLSRETDDLKYAKAANQAGIWLLNNAWITKQGLLYDLWDRKTKAYLKVPNWNFVTKDGVGRPLADDWIFLELHKQTGTFQSLEAFLDIIEHLQTWERPAGNWIDFIPCNPNASHGGLLHPRQAFWWGRPFLAAYELSNGTSKEYLKIAQRAGMWYVNASRLDGGMFRKTAADFTTSTFGQVTSGIACAALLWMDIHDADGNDTWLHHASTGLNWVIGQQFIPNKTSDENLKGAILELTNPMAGGDSSPFHLRDIATSFTLQALGKAADVFLEENANKPTTIWS